MHSCLSNTVQRCLEFLSPCALHTSKSANSADERRFAAFSHIFVQSSWKSICLASFLILCGIWFCGVCCVSTLVLFQCRHGAYIFLCSKMRFRHIRLCLKRNCLGFVFSAFIRALWNCFKYATLFFVVAFFTNIWNRSFLGYFSHLVVTEESHYS